MNVLTKIISVLVRWFQFNVFSFKPLTKLLAKTNRNNFKIITVTVYNVDRNIKGY